MIYRTFCVTSLSLLLSFSFASSAFSLDEASSPSETSAVSSAETAGAGDESPTSDNDSKQGADSKTAATGDAKKPSEVEESSKKKIEKAPKGDKERWEELETAAERAFIEGKIEDARTLWQEALDFTKKNNLEVERATTLNQLNHLYVRTGEFDQAYESLKEALSIREQKLGAKNILVAETMGNLGLVCQKLHRIEESEDWYEKSLAVKRGVCDPGDPGLAITLHNLANLYSSQLNYKRSDELFQEALEIDRKHYGDNHLEIARDYTSIGINQLRHKKYDQAIAFFDKALEQLDGLKKADNKESIASLRERMHIHHYLGLAYGRTDRPAQAKLYYQSARKQSEKLHGKGHPLTTVGVLNLARNADELGDQERAESLYMEALAIEEERQNKHEYLLTECLLELGHFHQRHDMSDEAERYYRKALETYDKLKPYEKRKLYELPVALADLLRKSGHEEDADEISRRYLHVHTPHSEKHFRL